MITRPDPAPQGRSARVVRLSLVLSLVVHLAALLLAFETYDALEHLRPHQARPPKHDDETVTLSTALHFERRPRAASARPNAGGTIRLPQRMQPRSLASVRVAPAAGSVAIRKPAAPPPPPPHRELAKTMPLATPQPRSKPQPRAKPQPTAPPALTLPPAPHVSERQVALLQHPAAERAVTRPSHASLSATRLVQIQSDLAASIARDRARENPLSNVARRVTPASTIRRDAIDVAGTQSLLRGAQGLCSPSQTWTADGYIYFYVSCRTQRADGTLRNEVIPWPLRFRPSEVAYGPSGPAPPPGEIPLPLPGWKLPASQYIDPDVLDFLRERRASAVAGSRVER